jgi:hypothetical protein
MLQKIRFVFFFFNKKDPKLSLSELLSMMTRIQFNPTQFIWPSMWTRLEHAHCLETIHNMWFLGKRESVNAWKKADFAILAWVWTRSTSFSSFQRSNWSPTYILHLFHLEDTVLLFLFLSESVKVRFLPRVDTFSFAQEPHVVYCF